MHALYVLGAIVCFVLALLSAHATWRIFRMPKRVYQAHQDLRMAVRALNKGTATPEQKAIIDDARKLGMVNTGFSVAKDGAMQMHHYVTKLAWQYFTEEHYPTVASIDAELEEFRIG